MILFSDRGTPDGYHQEHGYSGHTFKWCKDDGSFVYVQVHIRADGGFKVTNHTPIYLKSLTIFRRPLTTRKLLSWLERTQTMPLSLFSKLSKLENSPRGLCTLYVPIFVIGVAYG